jgi:hypothetical protein
MGSWRYVLSYHALKNEPTRALKDNVYPWWGAPGYVCSAAQVPVSGRWERMGKMNKW